MAPPKLVIVRNTVKIVAEDDAPENTAIVPHANSCRPPTNMQVQKKVFNHRIHYGQATKLVI